MTEVTQLEIVGKILTKVTKVDNEHITFETETEKWAMYHEQSCCESVSIEDIAGDLDDLIGSPIATAEERTEDPKDGAESSTWTFYVLATAKGAVTIRWYGSSNGYYGESACFVRVSKTSE